MDRIQVEVTYTDIDNSKKECKQAFLLNLWFKYEAEVERK